MSDRCTDLVSDQQRRLMLMAQCNGDVAKDYWDHWGMHCASLMSTVSWTLEDQAEGKSLEAVVGSTLQRTS